ncbi:MAG: GNAT family N-acetyltransferase [Candidatus Promineifilaceae bacterium]
MMNSEEVIDRFISKGGHEIWVRRLTADDTPFLVDIFENMSSDSHYKRFNQPLDKVEPARVWREAEQISCANEEKNHCLIAFTDREDGTAVPVGAARLVETDPGIAEVAISLRDDYQNIGIGRQLMRRLACEARDAGYRTLMASIRNDNPAIWKVFNSLPFEVIRVPEGSYSEVTIRLNRPEVIKQYLVNSI